MVPESACIPVPSEVTLLAAGFAVREGWMPLWAVVVAATAGNLVGSLIAYAIGRFTAGTVPGGRAGRAVTRCDEVFARHGNGAVFLARLMPLARSFVSLPAGHARVRIGPFVAMTALGCAVWATGFAMLGVLLGNGSATLAGPLGEATLPLGALVATIALLKAARTRGSMKRGEPDHDA